MSSGAQHLAFFLQPLLLAVGLVDHVGVDTFPGSMSVTSLAALLRQQFRPPAASTRPRLDHHVPALYALAHGRRAFESVCTQVSGNRAGQHRGRVCRLAP
jgi:hypothetical protein